MAQENETKSKLRSDLESIRDDLRGMADEIRLQLHLGGMEAKDRWRELEPRLHEVEKEVEATADDVSDEVSRVATVLTEELRELRDHLRKRL